MWPYILKRLISAIPVLFLVTLITLGLIYLVPGDPALVMAGPDASPEQIAAVRTALDLDRPVHQQILRWYQNLLQGDLGESYMLGRSVAQAIAERIPITAWLILYSMLLTVPIGILAGLAAAYWHNRWVDTTVMGIALIGVSVPSFWLSIMAILVFSVHLGWLPSGGYVAPEENFREFLRSLTLPAFALAVFQVGLLARMTRAGALDILRQDFVRTARAKGLSETMTVGRHVLSNVWVPILTVVAITINVALAGAVVIEQVFNLPGLGRLVVQAVLRRDYPVIQGSLLVVAAIMVMVNLLTDLLYAYLDPRIRYD